MRKRLSLFLTLIALLVVAFSCPLTPARLQWASEDEASYWEALEDSNCDINSDEAQAYIECAYNVREEWSSDYTLHMHECDDEYALIPGCDSNDAPGIQSQLSLATLGQHVPLTYSCERPDSYGHWYVHLGTDLAYADNYSFTVTISSTEAFTASVQASYDRKFEADPYCDEHSELNGNGSGSVFDDGFLEGSIADSGYVEDWCMHPERGYELSRHIDRSYRYYIVGALHPDLLTLEICSATEGSFPYDLADLRARGWQAFAEGGCPSPFPGHLTCTLMP
jgi:hypothetical protein